MKVFDNLKKTDQVVIFEIAIGLVVAIMFLRLMGVIFGRQSLGTVFGAENAESAEDLENLGGRGQARRAGRQAKRATKRSTRESNKNTMTKNAIARGKAQGSAGKIADESGAYDELPEESEVPSDEEYAEALEMAEHFNSLTQEDLDNMDEAEFAEYVEYAQMVGNAEQ